MDRADIVHRAFLDRVAARDFPAGQAPDGAFEADRALAIFRAQCASRHLDLTARAMQRAGQGYYTIGSSGHEGMAAVADALRPTDMAFLHYRDAAFHLRRAGQVPGQTPLRDMLLSFAASADDPISGGRHKVLGSKALNIPPQTSTIASHLPKAVGAAYALGLARRQPHVEIPLPADSIVLCSFGDASANHSTAQGAFNTAGWTAYQKGALPLLFVCEDNGIGISVRTPGGWIRAGFEHRPGLKYFYADGLDFIATQRAAQAAADYVRTRRRPAFLHLSMVRLGGHAGSDVEASYRDKAEIDAAEGNDPLLHSVRLLDGIGAATPDQALEIYNGIGEDCAAAAAEAVTRPRLTTAAEVSASLIPPHRDPPRSNGPSPAARKAAFGSDFAALETPQPMQKLINWALTDLMLDHPECVLFGEDVGRKGGVYGVTQKLQARFGRDRVFDTLLDEQAILGLAIGLGQTGFIPLPEIQFLAYLHNAEDQLRGEAATLPFFSNGQYANPMVLRIAGLGYQRGFGGHFHNDNSLAVLRDIPGLVVACPSNGPDAVGMLRECVRLAREEQRVCVFVEPIALYQTRDLHAPGDNGWAARYPEPGQRVALGQVGLHGDGTDIAIVTYGNGAFLSRQAQDRLAGEDIAARVIDMRWIAPLPDQALLGAVDGCKTVLIVDECRRTGSQSEALYTLFAEAGVTGLARVTAEDCFIATGPAYAATLPSCDGIAGAARALVKNGGTTE